MIASGAPVASLPHASWMAQVLVRVLAEQPSLRRTLAGTRRGPPTACGAAPRQPRAHFGCHSPPLLRGLVAGQGNQRPVAMRLPLPAPRQRAPGAGPPKRAHRPTARLPRSVTRARVAAPTRRHPLEGCCHHSRPALPRSQCPQGRPPWRPVLGPNAAGARLAGAVRRKLPRQRRHWPSPSAGPVATLPPRPVSSLRSRPVPDSGKGPRPRSAACCGPAGARKGKCKKKGGGPGGGGG